MDTHKSVTAPLLAVSFSSCETPTFRSNTAAYGNAEEGAWVFGGHGAGLYNVGQSATTVFHSKAFFKDNLGGFVSSPTLLCGFLHSRFHFLSFPFGDYGLFTPTGSFQSGTTDQPLEENVGVKLFFRVLPCRGQQKGISIHHAKCN